MKKSILLPSYKKELFIKRGNEIEEVETALKQIDEPSMAHIRTIVFRAERGNGKTWLALHLHRTVLFKNPNIFSVFINLSTFPNEYKQEQPLHEWYMETDLYHVKAPKDIAKDLMQWLLVQLNLKVVSESTLEDMTQDLVNRLDQKNSGDKFVLIADSVFEADWALLEILENCLFAPIAGLHHTLTIMTGRGKPYPWVSANLRTGSKELTLEELDVNLIEKQLAYQWPNKRFDASKILHLGGGSPLANYLLAREDKPMEESLADVADYLLSILPEGESGMATRDAIEALCLLQNFRDEEMADMIKAHNNSTITLEQTINLRDQLVKAGLLRWKDGGFELDHFIRIIIQNYLYTSKLSLWETLKRKAEDIYINLASRYPRHKDFYEQKRRAIDQMFEQVEIVH